MTEVLRANVHKGSAALTYFVPAAKVKEVTPLPSGAQALRFPLGRHPTTFPAAQVQKQEFLRGQKVLPHHVIDAQELSSCL